METLPNNFLGLEEQDRRYDRARFAVLPVPYDSTTSYQPGARHGPAAIITASQQLEWFDEELEVECHDIGIATLDAVEPNMVGPEAM
ncbi:MAG: arginase family protein, partial [Phycisphaerae bacterium]